MEDDKYNLFHPADQQVLFNNVVTPDGMVVYPEERLLYWTDTGTDTIEKAFLNGTKREVIIDQNLDQPRAIVIDKVNK